MRATVYRLRESGLWVTQCPTGRAYITRTWIEAMDLAHTITTRGTP